MPVAGARTAMATALAAVGLLVGCGGGEEATMSDPASTIDPGSAAPAPTGPSTTSAPVTTVASAVGTVIIADFSEPNSVEGWSVQNDTVMGGISRSDVGWSEGRLVFAGDVSLENNGGFASLSGPVSESNGVPRGRIVRVEALGDGHTYVMQLRTARGLYAQRFTTTGGRVESLSLAVSDFAATDFKLDPLPGADPVDPGEILQIAFYILDKQEGPFRLELRSIGVE